MLSKEEIEKAKRYFEDEIHYEKTTYNCVNHYRQTIIDNHIILYKYIKQLESDKQKLIEELEEEVTTNDIDIEVTDGNVNKWLYKSTIKTIKEKSASLINQYRKEILKIAKGENNE